MKIADAIDHLYNLYADSRLIDLKDNEVDAIDLAHDILTTLKANRGKAKATIETLRNCHSASTITRCKRCPYRDSPGWCVAPLDADITSLISGAYLQGGDDDDQT